MMGDTNAVTVLEVAHRRQLINAGVLRTDSLLLPKRPRLNELEHCSRAARARDMYGQLSMPTAVSTGTARILERRS